MFHSNVKLVDNVVPFKGRCNIGIDGGSLTALTVIVKFVDSIKSPSSTTVMFIIDVPETFAIDSIVKLPVPFSIETVIIEVSEFVIE